MPPESAILEYKFPSQVSTTELFEELDDRTVVVVDRAANIQDYVFKHSIGLMNGQESTENVSPYSKLRIGIHDKSMLAIGIHTNKDGLEDLSFRETFPPSPTPQVRVHKLDTSVWKDGAVELCCEELFSNDTCAAASLVVFGGRCCFAKRKNSSQDDVPSLLVDGDVHKSLLKLKDIDSEKCISEWAKEEGADKTLRECIWKGIMGDKVLLPSSMPVKYFPRPFEDEGEGKEKRSKSCLLTFLYQLLHIKPLPVSADDWSEFVRFERCVVDIVFQRDPKFVGSYLAATINFPKFVEGKRRDPSIGPWLRYHSNEETLTNLRDLMNIDNVVRVVFEPKSHPLNLKYLDGSTAVRLWFEIGDEKVVQCEESAKQSVEQRLRQVPHGYRVVILAVDQCETILPLIRKINASTPIDGEKGWKAVIVFRGDARYNVSLSTLQSADEWIPLRDVVGLGWPTPQSLPQADTRRLQGLQPANITSESMTFTDAVNDAWDRLHRNTNESREIHCIPSSDLCVHNLVSQTRVTKAAVSHIKSNRGTSFKVRRFTIGKPLPGIGATMALCRIAFDLKEVADVFWWIENEKLNVDEIIQSARKEQKKHTVILADNYISESKVKGVCGYLNKTLSPALDRLWVVSVRDMRPNERSDDLDEPLDVYLGVDCFGSLSTAVSQVVMCHGLGTSEATTAADEERERSVDTAIVNLRESYNNAGLYEFERHIYCLLLTATRLQYQPVSEFLSSSWANTIAIHRPPLILLALVAILCKKGNKGIPSKFIDDHPDVGSSWDNLVDTTTDGISYFKHIYLARRLLSHPDVLVYAMKASGLEEEKYIDEEDLDMTKPPLDVSRSSTKQLCALVIRAFDWVSRHLPADNMKVLLQDMTTSQGKRPELICRFASCQYSSSDTNDDCSDTFGLSPLKVVLELFPKGQEGFKDIVLSKFYHYRIAKHNEWIKSLSQKMSKDLVARWNDLQVDHARQALNQLRGTDHDYLAKNNLGSALLYSKNKKRVDEGEQIFKNLYEDERIEKETRDKVPHQVMRLLHIDEWEGISKEPIQERKEDNSNQADWWDSLYPYL